MGAERKKKNTKITLHPQCEKHSAVSLRLFKCRGVARPVRVQVRFQFKWSKDMGYARIPSVLLQLLASSLLCIYWKQTRDCCIFYKLLPGLLPPPGVLTVVAGREMDETPECFSEGLSLQIVINLNIRCY